MDYPDNAVKTGNKTEVRVNCEYCGDTKQHCYINVLKGVYHCFRCGASGRVTSQQRHLNDFQRKIKEFMGEVDMDTWGTEVKAELPEQYQRVWLDKKSVQRELALKYLVSQRGLWNLELKRYAIGYCASGYYRGRVIIPVMENGRGSVQYFVARSFTKLEPKYLNPHIEKKGVFFQSHEIEDKPFKIMVLCEGIFDAIRVGRVCPAVALLGKEMHYEQFEKLVNLADKIVVMLDADATSHAAKVHFTISRLKDSLMVIPTGKDPGEVDDMIIKRSLLHSFNLLGRPDFGEALDYYSGGSTR